MKLLATSSLRAGLISWACLLPFASLVGRDLIETEPSEVFELLVSTRPEEVTRGDRLVEENSTRLIVLLLERIRADSPEKKGKAAAALGVIISPWLREKKAADRASITSVTFRTPRPPVGRVQLAEAAGIRQSLQTAISALLKAAEVPSTETHWLTMSLPALCETLGEVTNDEAIDWAINELQQITSPTLAEPLIALVDSYLGIPPIFRTGLLCGNCTPAEVESFEQSQKLALAEARIVLSNQWAEVRALNTRKRVAFAIKSWRDYVLPRQRFHSDDVSNEKWLLWKMEPLVRLGAPAVEVLRAQQAVETEPDMKAVWEAVVATITGAREPQLVSPPVRRRQLIPILTPCE